ncbi:uncharacterized protein LOC121369366 [Gigantopelta aegis]|uniref:uncharacterized protein LOC121369366 n=1 Tax=Gigantopelta aegis TaxID=1735272 RepID=UPI001B88946C|nr:uncharacterized protein LOC121369366 [Gigantopelta aegis]
MVRYKITVACLLWMSVNVVSGQGAMSRDNDETTPTNDILSEDHVQESIRLGLENHVICPTGWTPAVWQVSAMGLDEPICLRIVNDSRSWEESRDVCRQDRGFLVKLESKIQIGTLSLKQCMDDLGIQSYWSGLHEEGSKLVWDELRPSVVQTFAQPQVGHDKVKRGWLWNRTTFEDIDDSCGMVSVKRDFFSLGRNRRSNRASDPSEIFKRKSVQRNRRSKGNRIWFEGRKRRSAEEKQAFGRRKRRFNGRIRRSDGDKRWFGGRKRRSSRQKQGSDRRTRRSDGTKLNLGFGRLGDMDDNLNNPLNIPGDHDPSENNSPNLMFLQHSRQNAKNRFLGQLLKHHHLRQQRKLLQQQQQQQQKAQKDHNGQVIAQNASETTTSTVVPTTSSQTTDAIGNDGGFEDPSQSSQEKHNVKRSTARRNEITTPPTVSNTTSATPGSSGLDYTSQTSTRVNTVPTSTAQSTTQASVVTSSNAQNGHTIRGDSVSTETSTSLPIYTTSEPINKTLDVDSSEISENATSSQDMSLEEKDLALKINETSTSKTTTTSSFTIIIAATVTTAPTDHAQTVNASFSSGSSTTTTPQTLDPSTITGSPTRSTSGKITPSSTTSTTSKHTISRTTTSSPPSSKASVSKSSTSGSTASITDHITPVPTRPSSSTAVTDSDDDDDDAIPTAVKTTASPATLRGSAATPPPKSEVLKFSNTLFPTSFHTAAATDYIKELAERLAFTKTPALQHSLEAKMNLQDCSERHASVCYKQPIRYLGRTPLCGEGWLGHPDVDKCYVVNASPLSFYDAHQQCLAQGGVMAHVDSDFYGNVTALALLFYRARTRIGTFAWVDLQSTNKLKLNGSCAYLDDFTLKAFPCTTFLPSVCEKAPRYFLAVDSVQPVFDDDDVENVFTSYNLPGSLLCPLTSSLPDQQVTWVKDGTVIPEIRVRESYRNGFNSRNLRLDSTLAQRLGRSPGEVVHPSRLQGLYWCQMWLNRPYRKIKSNKFLVIFNDVLTLHGVVNTKGIPLYDAALLNYMNAETGIPVTMSRDLSTINQNIFRSLLRLFTTVGDIDSVVKHAGPESGEVSFYVHLSLKHPVLDDVKDKIVTAYLERFHDVLTTMDFNISRQWNVERPVVSNIRIRRTDACIRDELTDKDTGHKAHFETTAVGQRANSKDVCGAIPAGFAVCKGDYETGAFWDLWHIDSTCNLHENTELFITPFSSLPKEPFMELDKVEIEDSNVIEVMDKLEDILEKTSELTEADIDKCAQVMKRIVEVNPSSEQVGKQLVSTVNKILDLGDTAMHKAEMKTKAASTIINNLEEFARKSDLGRITHARFVSPNIAVEMWDLQQGMKPVIGLGASVAGDWNTPLSQPRILTIRDRSDDMLMTFDVAIELPIALVTERMNAGTNITRLSMIIYRKVGLFTSVAPLSNNSHDVINSAIIAASLGGKKIVGLQDSIRMVFKPFKDRTSHLQTTRCVYWDFHRSGWSNEGCHYNGTKFGKEICVCDHLTNFAILLDFYGQRKPIAPDHELTLSIITLVGLSLSILGLSLTVISFIFFKKLRKGRAQLTLFNMALALVAANLVFLVGIKQTSNYVICLLVSMLLHYLLLVAFMWMLIEAVLQYFTFVKVLGSYISRYTLKTLISAWGLPLIPVITVLSIDYDLYRGRSNYCWLDLQAFYYAFALPVGVIIFVNVIMFVVVLVSITRRPDGLRNNQSKHKRASTNLKAAITVFVLLGLTWTFGYLAIDNARLVFQYIFTIFSSLQGFFIFILMVARRPQVREQWKAVCCRKRNERTQKKVSPTISNSASSRGSEGSSRGSDASSRGSDVGLHFNGSSRTLISTSSLSSTCSSMSGSYGNSAFVSSSFVNRAFNDGFDPMYNVHSRRNSTPYMNLYDKPCDIKQ